MKLKCPACGSPIASDNINIRSMSAVCSHCDNVFTFKPTDARPARKLKVPQQITTHSDSDDALHFSFKWSWRTEPPVAMAGMAVMVVGLIIAFVAILVEGPNSQMLAALAPLLALSILPAYVLGAIALNSTHYKIEGDQLHTYTTPLLFPYYGRRTVPLWDITDVTTVQTLTMPGASSREAFYNVYAHTSDGDRIMLARLVNYEHAHYIAQELRAFIDSRAGEARHDAYFDLSSESRLADHEADDTASDSLDAGDLPQHDARG